MCTSKEVTEGEYKEAIVLPKGKYCLKAGEHLTSLEESEEKRNHFKTVIKKLPIEEKKNIVTAKVIVEDIIAREAAQEGYTSEVLISSGDNLKTLTQAAHLLQDGFDSNHIAAQMINDLQELFPVTDVSIMGGHT